jgi:hypothetical protein
VWPGMGRSPHYRVPSPVFPGQGGTARGGLRVDFTPQSPDGSHREGWSRMVQSPPMIFPCCLALSS